jgi:hypothetical protein
MSTSDTGDFLRLTLSWLKIVTPPQPVIRRVGKYPFFDTRLSVGYRRRYCVKKRITGNFDLATSGVNFLESVAA